MATYPVRTVRARTQRSGLNSVDSGRISSYSQNVTNIEYGTSSNTLSPRSASLSKNELREARLQKFAVVYENDKQNFVEKEKKKNREKLLAKLERYKGVGELGNKMCCNPMSEEEKYDGHLKATNLHQEHQDECAVLEENLKNETKKLRMAVEKLTVKDSSDNPVSIAQPKVSGQKLGGSSTFNRVRGEHPLLDKLNRMGQLPDA